MTSPKPAIVTIGNFDGVHLGHQKLIREVADRARALGLCSLAITFDPHPEQVLFPERRLTHLSSSEERRLLLEASGMDDVWVCPFTTELARLEPEDFMRMVTERHPIAELWVGSDFALGRGRKGTISVLAEIGSAWGWGLHIVPPYTLEGQVVSSTAIRTLLGAGAVRATADLLGRPYSVSGVLDADLLTVDPLRTLPRSGLYQGQIILDEKQLREVVADVPSTPGDNILLDTAISNQPIPATLEFLRRVD